jgi:hypothetical protein
MAIYGDQPPPPRKDYIHVFRYFSLTLINIVFGLLIYSSVFVRHVIRPRVIHLNRIFAMQSFSTQNAIPVTSIRINNYCTKKIACSCTSSIGRVRFLLFLI